MRKLQQRNPARFEELRERARLRSMASRRRQKEALARGDPIAVATNAKENLLSSVRNKKRRVRLQREGAGPASAPKRVVLSVKSINRLTGKKKQLTKDFRLERQRRYSQAYRDRIRANPGKYEQCKTKDRIRKSAPQRRYAWYNCF